MKKVRYITYAATILLMVVLIVGIIMQIISPRSATETAFEIIALVVSCSSVTIAIVTQISAYRDHKKFTGIIRELHEIDRDVDSGAALDQSVRNKLDELIALDSRIYHKLAKTMKPKGKK